MEGLTLVIGNKNYSSWSLRPWLLMRHMGIAFNEVRIPLYRSDSAAALAAWSPTGLVPVLQDGNFKVWDSLAICEYLNEKFPDLNLWPQEGQARAVARSVSAEMHSGFSNLRQAMSMNCRARRPGRGRTPESLKDIERIVAIWSECRERYGRGGEFLFGPFTIADAMYAPVVLRFQTYGVELEGTAQAYARTMLGLPAMQEWVAQGCAESERIVEFEDPE